MAEDQEKMNPAENPPAEGRGRSRARKPGESDGSAGKVLKILGCALLIGAVGTGGIYAAMAQKYNSVFLPGTVINGVDASEKPVEEVKNLINQGAEQYRLTLEERDGNTEEIAGNAVGIKTVFDGSIEKLLAEQNKYTWLKRKKNPESFTIDTVIDFDESALYREIGTLACMEKSAQVMPENAYISDYINGEGYKVIPETRGTAVDEAKLQEAAYNAMLNLQPVLNMDEAGVYREAAIRQDDPGLNATVDRLNKACVMNITYKFGDETEVLNGDEIHKWVGFDDAGNVTVNEAMVEEYVKGLAERHDTYGGIKQFKTTGGNTVEVKGGTYGWRINQKDETAQLVALVQAGEDVEREPIYKQTAATRENSGIGNTYVEVNLGEQHLYYYKDGKLALESDFVSGNTSRGMGTPNGVYAVAYKQRNATLRGQGYSTPVSYWMPFNNGIGFHDANWRGSFGGTIYKTNGSHGCINMPPSKAKELYGMIDQGCVVVCHSSTGSGRKSGSSAPAAPAVTQPAVPEVTLPETTEAVAQPAGPAGDTSGPAAEGPGAAASPAAPATEAAPQPAATEAAPQPAATEAAPQPAAPEAAPQPAAEPAPAAPGGAGTDAPVAAPDSGNVVVVPGGDQSGVAQPGTGGPGM